MILSLFDFTTFMVQPWAEAGHECVCVDQLHYAQLQTIETYGRGKISKVPFDLSKPEAIRDVIRSIKPKIVFSFPPCTELSSVGAKHWNAKLARDPMFQIKAAEIPMEIERECQSNGIPFFVENPAGALAGIWRPADFSFDPADFGGYLPVDDQHPLWPGVIPNRDAYTKRTYLWTGEGFICPDPLPVTPITVASSQGNVAPQFVILGGKSLVTKTIRSATPRGFARAVYIANRGQVE